MISPKKRQRYGGFAIALLATVMAGCGDSSSAPSTARSSGDSSSDLVASAGAALSQETPEVLIERYLAAVKRGDVAVVNRLLTSMAQEKTMEMNIAVAPPGSETASYRVGTASAVAGQNDLSRVLSHWTELDDTGTPQTVEITWIVRKEPAGWRVAGMVGQFIEGQAPITFNFEDPEEVIRQQEYAQEGMDRNQRRPRQAEVPAQNRPLQQ